MEDRGWCVSWTLGCLLLATTLCNILGVGRSFPGFGKTCDEVVQRALQFAKGFLQGLKICGNMVSEIFKVLSVSFSVPLQGFDIQLQ